MDAKRADTGTLEQRLHEEMIDAVDAEFELKLDDLQLAGLLEHTDKPPQQTLDRQIYFRELLRLQGELVKLQDWLAHRKLKLVVLFEGRDAAGKGGVIKRISQRLNPRICRVVALPAPTERERSQGTSSATWSICRRDLHKGQGRDVGTHPYYRSARWWVVEGVDKKKARLNCIPGVDGHPCRAS